MISILGKELVIPDTLSTAYIPEEYEDSQLDKDLEICMILPASEEKLEKIKNEINEDTEMNKLKTTIL